MKMVLQRRALDKIYKRRDRYEIPEWQRGEVWDTGKKQQLIDTILRGWRLPKLYLVKNTDDAFEVVDGQQRLNAIYEFFGNELALSPVSAKEFGGPHYKDLKEKFSDAFDDYEIDYDEISDATEAELKQFFQRLQEGLSLTSSEKLNSVHSKLRDYCRAQSTHNFFKISVAVADTRFSHFDILSKVAALEIEGMEVGLRFDDIKPIFESQSAFSATSAVAKRIRGALDFLVAAFPKETRLLKNRTVVQSIISLACRLLATGNAAGLEKTFSQFVSEFMLELSRQVELGQVATDYDFIRFQKSISSNVKSGARTRQEILLRKAFMHHSGLALAFDPSALVESGVTGRVKELGEAIIVHIARLNSAYAALNGTDLFKATNKTTSALLNLAKPVNDLAEYNNLIRDLYFVFRESTGQRLADSIPISFSDVNVLRTDLQHDTDHGDKAKVKAKKTQAGSVFNKYAGSASPDALDPGRFVLVQANILSALELDLINLSFSK